jgi:hypothetical protein
MPAQQHPDPPLSEATGQIVNRFAKQLVTCRTEPTRLRAKSGIACRHVCCLIFLVSPSNELIDHGSAEHTGVKDGSGQAFEWS